MNNKRTFNFGFVFKNETTTKVKVWSVVGASDDSAEYLSFIKDKALKELCSEGTFFGDELWLWDVNYSEVSL